MMNQVFLWTAAILSAIYGLLTAFAGLSMLRIGKVQVWAAWGFFLCGMLLVAAGILALLHSSLALWILVIGLLGIHVLAINNGYKLFGKLNPSHHLVRLIISVVLVGLTYLGLS
jgi:hypothetical protein